MNAVTSTQHCSRTDLDWRVVEIARSDGPRSVLPDDRITRVFGIVFGTPLASRLANEPLETLRRFCVRAWYWHWIRAPDVRAFVEAGYSMDDAIRILSHVAGIRGFAPSIEGQAT